MAQKVSVNYTVRAQDDSKSTKSITNVNPAATGDQLLAFTQGLVGLTSDFYVDADRIDRQSLSDYAGKTPTTGTVGEVTFKDDGDEEGKFATFDITLNRNVDTDKLTYSAWYIYNQHSANEEIRPIGIFCGSRKYDTSSRPNVIFVHILGGIYGAFNEPITVKVTAEETDTHAAATFTKTFNWED